MVNADGLTVGLQAEYAVIKQPEFHFVFVEKQGPFAQTVREAWRVFDALRATADLSQVAYKAALYQMQPEMIYRAGVVLNAAPSQVPEGLKYELMPGNVYAQFVLIGSYSQLGEASGKIMKTVAEHEQIKADIWFIERYVHLSQNQDELRTEILVPVRE